MKASNFLIVVILLGFLLTIALAETPECYPISQELTYEPPTVEDIITTQQEFSEDFYSGHLYATGDSMKPTLTGNEVCVCRVTNDYQVGDIISFFKDYDGVTNLIMHRIIEKDANLYITKGDNNIYPDPDFIFEDDIVCEVENVKLITWVIGALNG